MRAIKALKKIVSTIGIIIFLLFSLCGCGGYNYYNLKPDDSLSHAVYDAVGEDLDYHGKKESDVYGFQYEYELRKKDAETISRLVKAVNSTRGDGQKKIQVAVYVEDILHPDAWTVAFILCNYSDVNLEKADYDGFRSLYIGDYSDSFGSIAQPSTYTGIEGIRKVKLGIQMQQRADEEGIDWYECWPDLEEVTVIGADLEE